MTATRGLSATLFALVLGTFFLPWLHISCEGQPVASFTGRELVTGKSVDREVKLESRPLAVACLALAAFGLVATVVTGKSAAAAKLASLTAVLAAITVFLTWWDLNREIQQEAQKNGLGNAVQVQGAIGFWLAAGTLVTVVLVNLPLMTVQAEPIASNDDNAKIGPDG